MTAGGAGGTAAAAVQPRTIPGGLHPLNRGALDWAWNGLVLYGCHQVVVAVDPESLQVLQTFHGHAAPVVRVRWAPQDTSLTAAMGSPCTFASADAAGTARDAGRVLVWSLDRLQPVCTFPLPSGMRAVADVQWQPHAPDILAIVYVPATVVLWNTTTIIKIRGWPHTRVERVPRLTNQPLPGRFDFAFFALAHVWSREFHSDLNQLAFDPFDRANCCALTVDGHMWRISEPCRVATEGIGRERTSKDAVVRRYQLGEATLTRRGTRTDRGPTDAGADAVQIVYSPTERDVVFCVTRSKVLIMDVSVDKVLATIPTEARGQRFAKLLPCRYFPDLLYTVLDNGSVAACVRSARLANLPGAPASYDVVCVSDALRTVRGERFVDVVLAPLHELRLAAITSEGRLVVWQLRASLPQAPPQLAVVGCLDSLAAGPRCLAMFAVRRAHGHTLEPVADPRLHHALVGTDAGNLLVVDVQTGDILRQFALVEGGSVRQVAWIDASRAVAVAVDIDGDSGAPQSRLLLVDLRSGASAQLKPAVGGDEESAPITSVAVSHHQQYLAVLRRDEPLELWDLATLRPLSTPAAYVSIAAMEWSAWAGHRKRDDPTPGGRGPSEEELILHMSDGVIVHCMVAHGAVVEERKFAMKGHANVAGMAWLKKDRLLFTGDASGAIHILYEKTARTRTLSPGFGPVLRIRHAPARSGRRIAVLFAHAVAVYEVDKGDNVAVAHFGSAGGTPSPSGNLATALALSPRLLGGRMQRSLRAWSMSTGCHPTTLSAFGGPLVMADGSIRVLDIFLRKAASLTYDRPRLVAVPLLLSGHQQAILRAVMSYAPWRLDLASVASDQSDDAVAAAQLVAQLPTILRGQLASTGLPMPARLTHIAHYFGDQFGVDMWRLVSASLQEAQAGVGTAGAFARVTTAGSVSRVRSPATPTAALEPSEDRLPEPMVATTSLIEDDADGRAASAAAAEPALATSPSTSAGFLLGMPMAAGVVTSVAHASVEAAALSALLLRHRFGSVLADRPDDAERPVPEQATDRSPTAELGPGDLRHLGHLAGAAALRAIQLERTAQHERVADTYELTQAVVKKNVMLGQPDRAVQLLIASRITAPQQFRADAYKACLLAALSDPENAVNTIKVIADAFVANGAVSDGIELLCLIGRGADACGLLQAHGQWEDAAALAKTMLPPDDALPILRRWAAHLLSLERTEDALLVQLSSGDLRAALKVLLDVNRTDLAVALAECCEEAGVALVPPDGNQSHLAAMFMAHAATLDSLGLAAGSQHYRARARAFNEAMATAQLD